MQKGRKENEHESQADNYTERLSLRPFPKGQEFLVGDLCPPLCHELWSVIYPYVFALQNGGILDHGAGKAAAFDAKCPDEARVWIHGEVVKE